MLLSRVTNVLSTLTLSKLISSSSWVVTAPMWGLADQSLFSIKVATILNTLNPSNNLTLHFLHKNIPSDYKSYSTLERIKDFLRKFVKNKKAYKLKKKLLVSLKGLHLIAVLFPLALKVFT